MKKKSPNAIDVHVGSRVRLRRTILNMTQDKLGEHLGITFQQVQKYEKGTNRIGASRLFHIATVLNAPISYFFEDAPSILGIQAGDEAAMAVEMLPTREGMALSAAFGSIDNDRVRRSLLKLVEALRPGEVSAISGDDAGEAAN